MSAEFTGPEGHNPYGRLCRGSVWNPAGILQQQTGGVDPGSGTTDCLPATV